MAPELIRLDVEEGQIWDERERATIQQAALDIGNAIARDIQRVAEQTRRISNLLVEPGAEIQPAPALAGADAFLKVYGRPVRFLRKAIPADGFWGEARTRQLVWVYRNAPHSVPGDVPASVGNRPEFSVHELGHVFENVIQAAIGTKKGRNSIPSAQLSRPKGFFQRGRFQQSPKNNTNGEVFADMFIGWVYDRWETVDGQPDSPLRDMGTARKQFMDGIMIELIETAISFNRNR